MSQWTWRIRIYPSSTQALRARAEKVAEADKAASTANAARATGEGGAARVHSSTEDNAWTAGDSFSDDLSFASSSSSVSDSESFLFRSCSSFSARARSAETLAFSACTFSLCSRTADCSLKSSVWSRSRAVSKSIFGLLTARDLEPAVTLDLAHPSHQLDDDHTEGCTLDYYLRPAGRFQQVSEIALYFCDNFDMPEGAGGASNMDDTDEDRVQTEISYVGFKGQGTNVKRKAVKAVYETQGMPKDHKTPGNEYLGKQGL